MAGIAERRLTRRWTRPLPRPADEVLVMLSEAADGARGLQVEHLAVESPRPLG